VSAVTDCMHLKHNSCRISRRPTPHPSMWSCWGKGHSREPMSGTHYRKLFSVVTLLQFLSLCLRHSSSLRLSVLSLLTNTLPGPSASEVTTLWRYTNLFIIIIIIMTGRLATRRLGRRRISASGVVFCCVDVFIDRHACLCVCVCVCV